MHISIFRTRSKQGSLAGLNGVITETKPRSQGSLVLAVVLSLPFLLEMQKPFFFLFFPYFCPESPGQNLLCLSGLWLQSTSSPPAPLHPPRVSRRGRGQPRRVKAQKLAAALSSAYGPDDTNASSYSDASSPRQGQGEGESNSDP